MKRRNALRSGLLSTLALFGVNSKIKAKEEITHQVSNNLWYFQTGSFKQPVRHYHHGPIFDIHVPEMRKRINGLHDMIKDRNLAPFHLDTTLQLWVYECPRVNAAVTKYEKGDKEAEMFLYLYAIERDHLPGSVLHYISH